MGEEEEEERPRQGSLATPIEDTLAPTSSATYGSPEQGLSPQERGRTRAPVSCLGENKAPSEAHSSLGEFSSKQMKLGRTTGRWEGNTGSVATHGKPCLKGLRPRLHSHGCTCPRRVRASPKLKRSGKELEGREGRASASRWPPLSL